MKILKHKPVFLATCLLLAGGHFLADAMEAPKVDLAAWRPEEPAADAKPVSVLLLRKGDDKEAFVIKQVSVCDQNNIWCVANDGTKDAVYQLTEKGLTHKFDGVYVSVGREIVSAINDKQEVFELKGQGDTTWEKVEGLKLSKIYRPSDKVGWGLLEDSAGKKTLLMFDHNEGIWSPVQNADGDPATGVVAVSANAEDIAVALTDKGEILKRDLSRINLIEKAQAVVAQVKKKGRKKGKKGAPSEAHHEVALSVAGAGALPVVPTMPKDLAAAGKKNKKAKKHKKAKNHSAESVTERQGEKDSGRKDAPKKKGKKAKASGEKEHKSKKNKKKKNKAHSANESRHGSPHH